MLPRGEVARPALRRRLLLRSPDHRHLLPPVVPGPHPGVRQHHLLPEPGGRAGCRLPGLQAVPPRCHAGQPRLGRRRDRCRPRDAADRRRRRRPRRRRGPGPAGRLHAPPPVPHPHRRARRRAVGPGSREAGADRAGADRDHRPQLRRRGVRGRLLQRAAVQRHRARGLRRQPHPAPRSPRRPGRRRHRDHAAGRAHAVRRRGAAWVPGDARDPGRRGGRTRLVRPHAHPSQRHRHDAARPAGRAGAGADGVREGDVPAHRPPRHLGGHRARPAAARCRLRPGRCARLVRGRPAPRARWCGRCRACACPATSTATRSRCAPCSASRCRSRLPARWLPG